MKILIDARLYGLENAGLGRYLINLIKSLQKIDKHNNYVLLLRKKYFNELNLSSNFKKVLVDVKHYSFKEQFLLPNIIRRENPDLVHYPHFNISIFSSKPFVVTIHDLLMHKQKGKEATTLGFVEYFIKRIFYKFIFSDAIRRSKYILVPSDFVKKEIISNYEINKDKIKVIYEGVDFENNNSTSFNLVKDKYSIKIPYLLYVGNAYPHKNIKKAIQAVGNVNSKTKLFFTIVSARNIFVERLNKYIQKNNFTKFVKILNFVEDNDLKNLYKGSLAFIYPSLSEGFGLQGLEAMSLKTLCLASDIEAFKEIYQDNAIYFDPSNISSIEKQITNVINMTKLEKDKIVDKAFEFVKKYSWDKMAELTLETYEGSISL